MYTCWYAMKLLHPAYYIDKQTLDYFRHRHQLNLMSKQLLTALATLINTTVFFAQKSQIEHTIKTQICTHAGMQWNYCTTLHQRTLFDKLSNTRLLYRQAPTPWRRLPRCQRDGNTREGKSRPTLISKSRDLCLQNNYMDVR